jgi:hypothetical protein
VGKIELERVAEPYLGIFVASISAVVELFIFQGFVSRDIYLRMVSFFAE